MRHGLPTRRTAYWSGMALPSAARRGPRVPRVDYVTADFAYLRFHGRTPPEAPRYSDQELRREAKLIRSLAVQGIDTYVYFNNDALAHAPANAARLRELLKERRSAA
jgi:uncharacterized protein YecE (DUF72 family)